MLVKINITLDTNEYGERAYLVTAVYRHEASGRLMSVPDTKGWRTRAQAIAEAERMCGVAAGTIVG